MRAKLQHGMVFLLLAVVLYLLWLSSSSFVNKIGAEVNMREDLEAANPGCVSSKLKDYKRSKTSALYRHPDVVHYVMFTLEPQYQLIFRDYISMLSVCNLLKPERLILHTNAEIVGAYWKSMQTKKGTKIEIKNVERVSKLSYVMVAYIQHEADYNKVKILHETGGPVSNFDVVMVNGTKWRQNQNISECVLSLDGQILNIGALSCIKGSPLAKKWLDKYHTDYRQGWIYNSGQVPADILIKDANNTCHNVYLDETIAQDPLFGLLQRWVNDRCDVNWKEKSAAHYYYNWFPQNTPLKSMDMDERLIAQDSLGELFRHVLDV